MFEMRRNVFVYAMCISLLVGCSKDSLEIGNSQQCILPLHLQTFIESCLVFENDQYSISADREDAENMGVSKAEYDELYAEMQKANSMIINMKEEYATDPDIKTVKFVDLNKSRNGDYGITRSDESATVPVVMPSGSLFTIGLEQASSTCWAPYGMRAVEFNCFSYSALLAFMTVTTQTQGEVISGLKVGNLGGAVEVNVAASNTNCKVTFQTTDSTGGKCYWKGVK